MQVLRNLLEYEYHHSEPWWQSHQNVGLNPKVRPVMVLGVLEKDSYNYNSLSPHTCIEVVIA